MARILNSQSSCFSDLGSAQLTRNLEIKRTDEGDRKHEAARGLLATDHVIFNHGQVTWTTPEMAPLSPNYHTTPRGGRFSSQQI
ncbi:hypothetical protein TNCV_2210551 [Trichonephila clavipes]|nr:hypothetical protein TNCV_2210551 [Trichonephila clavipes]